VHKQWFANHNHCVHASQAKDLAAWHADAEEFHHSSDVGGFQENLRTCAETLYLSLFEVTVLP